LLTFANLFLCEAVEMFSDKGLQYVKEQNCYCKNTRKWWNGKIY